MSRAQPLKGIDRAALTAPLKCALTRTFDFGLTPDTNLRLWPHTSCRSGLEWYPDTNLHVAGLAHC